MVGRGDGENILEGANSYMGPTVLAGGTTIISSDAAFGAGGGLEFSGGSLTLAGDWNTAREVSVSVPTSPLSNPTTIDTSGFQAILSGVLSGPGALTKSGAGTLTLTAAQPYSGAITVNGGTFRLSGAGAVRGGFTVVNSGLVLDNSAAAVSDRLNDAALLTLSGGQLTLLGDPSAPVVEDIGATTINAGSRQVVVTLSAPGTSSTILRPRSLFIGGTTLVRGDRLGGAGPAGFTRFFPTTAAPPHGLAPNVFADDSSTGSGSSFAFYDTAIDATGPIGFRPLHAAEYSAGSTIQNPSNGGTTPENAQFLASAHAGAIGARNSVASVTLEPGTALSLNAGQTLAVTGSGVLARAGAAPVSLAGGTLDFGAAAGVVYAAGALDLGTTVIGTAGIRKLGPGPLTFSGVPAYSGGTILENGALRLGSLDQFAQHAITIISEGLLEIAGADRRVGGLAGRGRVSINDAMLTLGTLDEEMTFAGTITGNGRLAIADGGAPLLPRTLSGPNDFTGGVTLESGILNPIGTSPLGTGTLTVNGGALRPNGVFAPLPNPLLLNANLNLEGGSISFTLAGPATGSGSVVVRGPLSVRIGNSFAHTGELRATYGAPGSFSVAPGTIDLSLAQGAILAASRIRIESGGSLSMFAPPDPTGSGRIADTIPVQLASSSLALRGSATVPAVESIGALSTAGFSTVTVTAVAPASARLTASTLVREDRGTFHFRGTLLGNLAGAGVSQIHLSAPPDLVGGGGSGANTSILPYAVGDRLSGGTDLTLVTYDATRGVRPLDVATEFTTAFPPPAATNNVRRTALTTHAGTTTVNALLLDTSGTILGPGTLNVTSGAIVKANTNAAGIENHLEFGAAEASIFVGGFAGDLILSGAISGTGGLTKSGPHNLTLSEANTFTGPLTINAGVIGFRTTANLGQDTSPIIVHGSGAGAGLRFLGSERFVLSRGIQAGSGFLRLDAANIGAQLEVAGAIRGAGGIIVNGPGEIILSGSNEHTGPTYVSSGTLRISSDAALGMGGELVLSGSARLDGPWSTSRPVGLIGPDASIHTAGFNAEWSGPLIAEATAPMLTKRGAGELKLTGKSKMSGTITINEGAIRLAGDAEVNTSWSLNGSTSMPELVLDHAARADSNQLDGSGVTLRNGILRVLGHPDAAVNERGGNLTLPTGYSIVELTAPGSGSTTLTVASAGVAIDGTLRVRGANLGGAQPGPRTRMVILNTPNLVNGLLPRVIAEESSSNVGASFATYDGSVRPLLASEYVTGSTIQNPANGGPTPTTANFLATGSTTAQGTNSLNSLTLAPGATLSLGAGASLNLTAAGVLAQRGAPSVIEGGRLVFDTARVSFSGDGDLSVNSSLSGSGGFTKSGLGTLTLNGNSSYNGTFAIAEGRLQFSPPEAFQGATIHLLSEATLDLRGVSSSIGSLQGNGDVALGAGRLRVGNGHLTGVISGTAGVDVHNGSLTLAGASTYSGTTRLFRGTYKSLAPALTLSGDGTLLASSAFTIADGGALTLHAGGDAAHGRIGTVPVELDGASFGLTGSAGVPFTESAGSLTGTGYSSVGVTAPFSTTIQLVFTGLERKERGTFGIFLSNGAGSSTSRAQILFGPDLSAATIGGSEPAQHPILPFVVGTAERSVFLKYDPVNGIRPLNETTETAFNTFAPGANVTTSGATVNGPITINSLLLRGGNSLVAGTGEMTITSGAVSGWLTNSITKPLSFGAREGFFYTDDVLNLGGAIAGSNGVTFTAVSANGIFNLTSANTFTGPLTLNSGTVRFSTPANLGAEAGPITVHTATLEYIGAAAVELPRGFRLVGREAHLASTGGAMTVAGPITGTGALRVRGDVRLSGPSSHTGYTRVDGKLTFGGSGALSATPLILLNPGGQAGGGVLELSGPWSSTATVELASGAGGTIDTRGFDAAIGSLRTSDGSPTFTKLGAGRLTIVEASVSSANGVVTEGGLVVSAPVAWTGSASVAAGAELQLHGSLGGSLSVRGKFSPGAPTGTLVVRDASFAMGSTLAIDILSATVFDQLATTVSLSIDETLKLEFPRV